MAFSLSFQALYSMVSIEDDNAGIIRIPLKLMAFDIFPIHSALMLIFITLNFLNPDSLHPYSKYVCFLCACFSTVYVCGVECVFSRPCVCVECVCLYPNCVCLCF